MNLADFTALNATEEELLVARQLASHYRSMCKAQNVYANPFDAEIPIELQRVFTHFLKAARVVIECKAEPTTYIAAQFDGLAWTGRACPFPNQLHTGNARLRYINYVSSREKLSGRDVKEDDYQVSNFDYESQKARRMAEKLGVSLRRALRMVPREFSKAYLKHAGVWALVRCDWESDS